MIPLTSDDDWVSEGLALRRSKAAHPAGRALDNQAGAAELLAAITAPPLPAFEEAASEVYFELHDLLASKQADYGPHAISRSPGGALNGINVRMHDKLSRVIHLTGTAARHESVRDTYRDLANYAVIAVMVLDGTWPE